jgi:hypothetical protein
VRGLPRPAPLVLAGQVAFVGFLAVSVALHPGFVLKGDEGGISNYGVHLVTVLPYTLAFGTCAGCSLAAAGRYPSADGAVRWFRSLLVVYSGLLLLTLVSTYVYTLDTGLKDAHVAIGAVTVLFQTGASVAMCLHLRGRWDWWLLALQVAGTAVAGITLVGLAHLLFVGQAVAAVAFGVLLIRTGYDVPFDEGLTTTGGR